MSDLSQTEINRIEALPEAERRALPDHIKFSFVRSKLPDCRILSVSGDPVAQVAMMREIAAVDIDPKPTKEERTDYFFHSRARGYAR